MTYLFRDDNKRSARASRRRAFSETSIVVFPVARSGTADPAALDLERWFDIVDSLLEELDRIVLGPVFHLLQGVVKHALGDRLPPLRHQGVDELGHELAVVDRIRQDLAFRNFSASRHLD